MSDEPEQPDDEEKPPPAAPWWLRGLTDQRSAVSRREVLGQLLLTLGAASAAPGCGASFWNLEPDYDESNEPSLEAQRRYGWNLGARDHRLDYGGYVTVVPALEALATLATELTPVAWRHVHTGILFEATDAVPLETLGEEPLPFHPLRDELRMAGTRAMARAHAIGAAVAALYQGCALQTALVLDLEGAESVAFAAGVAGLFEPVFGIANWPHPLGQVPAHLALAAVAQYQEAFRAGRTRRGANPPPCFVLDRLRLAPEVSDDRFDNRYLASLPSAATLRAGNIAHVLYVVPDAGSLPELDDLNEDLVGLAQAGLDVRALALDGFLSTGDEGPYFYGIDPAASAGFWLHYPWCAVPDGTPQPVANPLVRGWSPSPRLTRFSRRSVPRGFGETVMMSQSGRVLHPRFDHRGSWHRSWGRGGG